MCACRKSAVNILTKKCVSSLFLTFYRSKTSRWLGYYFRKLSQPIYDRRKEEYREKVLKPLEQMKNLNQRLNELNAKDPILDAQVNIGFCTSASKITLKDRLQWRKRLSEREKKKPLDPRKQVLLDLDAIQEDWQMSEGPHHIQNIADHYGIFNHLYDHGYFTPYVPLKISYNCGEYVNPIYMGNVLEAAEVAEVPNVSFKSKPNDLWTLILTNLDGHLLDTNSEYLHWFVGNIKGNDLKSGETLCDYMRPFPMRGSGYHRLVFVLYKQEKEIDFASIRKNLPCMSLKERTFKTFDFYKKFQDSITPAGLGFFQCIWDPSLKNFFHHVLNMREPVFEYIEPPMYIKPQVHFPHLEPFNLYLDRYRDPKEIKKEILLKRLKTIEPFKEESPMPKYPCLHKPENYNYSWQKYDKHKERLRIGKYRDLRPHSVYPQEDNIYPFRYKH